MKNQRKSLLWGVRDFIMLETYEDPKQHDCYRPVENLIAGNEYQNPR